MGASDGRATSDLKPPVDLVEYPEHRRCRMRYLGQGTVHSRRDVLRLALAGAVGSMLSALPFGSGVLGDSMVEGPLGDLKLEGGAKVLATNGETVLALLGDGRTITAQKVGFPPGASPRVGDIVGIDSGTNVPLCAIVRIDSRSIPTPTAHPVARWLVGAPRTNGVYATLGSVRLAPSSHVAEAVRQGRTVWIATLDTTLDDRLVLDIRSS